MFYNYKDAYGEFNAKAVQQVPVAVLKENGIEAKVGMKLYTNSGAVGKIVAVTAANATVDFNHELAGKELVFKIILRKTFFMLLYRKLPRQSNPINFPSSFF